MGSGEWGMGNGEWGVGSGEGGGGGGGGGVGGGEWGVGSGEWESTFPLPTPYSPLPFSVILSPKLLMKTGVGSFYPCSSRAHRGTLLRTSCVALIVPGLCGGEINPYNDASNFVAAY